MEKRFLVIKDGVAVNLILAADEYAASRNDLVEVGSEPGSPGIGWSYDGSSFTPPVYVPE